MALLMKRLLENKHLENGDYFVIIACFSLATFIVYGARCKLTGRSAVETDIGNEKFIFAGSRCRWNLKFRNSALSFGKELYRTCSTILFPHLTINHIIVFSHRRCLIPPIPPVPSTSGLIIKMMIIIMIIIKVTLITIRIKIDFLKHKTVKNKR